MDTRLSLRERNRERTRQEIEDAAFALFATQGFEATTVEQIANHAGVSPRTFFRHYPTKEDVVFGDHARTAARLHTALTEAGPGEPLVQRVRRAVLLVQAPGQHPQREVLRACLATDVPTVRARMHQLVEEYETIVASVLTAELEVDEDTVIHTQIVVGAIFGALRGARRAAAALPAADPQRLVETAFDAVEHGVRPYLSSPENGQRPRR